MRNSTGLVLPLTAVNLFHKSVVTLFESRKVAHFTDAGSIGLDRLVVDFHPQRVLHILLVGKVEVKKDDIFVGLPQSILSEPEHFYMRKEAMGLAPSA